MSKISDKRAIWLQYASIFFDKSPHNCGYGRVINSIHTHGLHHMKTFLMM